MVLALVVVASLGGGQALQALRDRIESDRASGGVVVPGDDYVYVSDGGPSPFGGTPTRGIQTIAMPAGRSTGRVIADTYVGTAYDSQSYEIALASVPVNHRVRLVGKIRANKKGKSHNFRAVFDQLYVLPS